MDVTVAVATFGELSWKNLARSRAVPSALDLKVPVVHVHGDTLHEARNEALDIVRTESICFLDADDELEPGYFDAMNEGWAQIRVPEVRYVVGGTPQPERVMRVAGHRHEGLCSGHCLAEGNWIVIGAVAEVDRLRAVGGFRDYPVYEDWDLWARAWKAGASFEQITGAVYRAHARPDSRNRGSLTPQAKHSVHQDIARANGLPVPA